MRILYAITDDGTERHEDAALDIAGETIGSGTIAGHVRIVDADGEELDEAMLIAGDEVGADQLPDNAAEIRVTDDGRVIDGGELDIEGEIFPAEAAIDLAVATVDVTDIGEDNAVFEGDLTELDGADSADVGFEFREDGASDWSPTTLQERTVLGAYDRDVSGLQEDTVYEMRAIAEANGVTATGEVQDFITESAIPDSAVAQYDSTALSGFSDGDVVDTWPDEVGDFNASATGGPLYRDSGINGNASVEYDGTDDYHNTTYLPDIPNNASAIAVVDGIGEGNAVFGSIDSDLNRRFDYGVRSDTNEWNHGYGDSAPSNTESSTGIGLITFRGDNGTFEFRLDGTEVYTFSYADNGVSDANLLLGARRREDNNDVDNFWSGSIGEFVLYENMSNSERDKEEQRLADKWGITL